jgi:DNA-3-methyladenine glycosylase II
MDLKIEDIAAARLSLSRMDDVLSKAHDVAPVFKWRKKPQGFKGLAFLIIEQQVSTASANAIIKKFAAGLGAVTPRHVLAAGESKLKTLGLSGQKASYIYLLARACAEGDMNFAKLRKLTDDDAIAELVRLKGVGRWTAEAYLMFGEGRTDLFPAGDLALQEGYKLAAHRKTRPTEKELYKIAEKWRPNRGIAALLLWAYYGHRKSHARTPAVDGSA